MLSRGSRYQHVKHFASTAANEVGAERFRGTRPRPIDTAEGVLEHVLSAGDRLDLLALNYYNDTSKWWLILDANPEIRFAGEVDLGQRTGEVIVIPRNQQAGQAR